MRQEKRKNLHNIPILQERRKELRKNQTPYELLLWKNLSRSQLGCKFRRQHSIGGYILDFYCPEKRLAIEIDGSTHVDGKEYDQQRTEYLESMGICVVRFWNQQIDENIEEVIKKIKSILQNRDVRYYEGRSDF